MSLLGSLQDTQKVEYVLVNRTVYTRQDIFVGTTCQWFFVCDQYRHDRFRSQTAHGKRTSPKPRTCNMSDFSLRASAIYVDEWTSCYISFFVCAFQILKVGTFWYLCSRVLPGTHLQSVCVEMSAFAQPVANCSRVKRHILWAKVIWFWKSLTTQFLHVTIINHHQPSSTIINHLVIQIFPLGCWGTEVGCCGGPALRRPWMEHSQDARIWDTEWPVFSWYWHKIHAVAL